MLECWIMSQINAKYKKVLWAGANDEHRPNYYNVISLDHF